MVVRVEKDKVPRRALKGVLGTTRTRVGPDTLILLSFFLEVKS